MATKRSAGGKAGVRATRPKKGGAKSGDKRGDRGGGTRRRRKATARRVPGGEVDEERARRRRSRVAARSTGPGPARRRPARRVEAREAAPEEGCDLPGDVDSPAVRAAVAAGSARTRGERAPGLVGLQVVPADRWGSGYDRFRVRADLAGSYLAVRERLRALGGVVTSSGGVRDPSAPVTVGRSATSLHYTGRAIDLNVDSGLQRGSTPYIVVRDGGTDVQPLWRVYAVVGEGDPQHPLFDGARIEERDWPALVWRARVGTVTVSRRARCVNLTDLFAEAGWRRIPARVGWKTKYMCCEWWHFQNQTGLQAGVTRFGDELRKVWSARVVEQSGLALGAVWSGGAFRV